MAEQFEKAGKNSEQVLHAFADLTKDGIQSLEVLEMYGKWVEHYEQDLQQIGYSSPLILANFVEEFYGKKRDLRVLDMAAGTGLLGRHLHARGFRNLDALDASEKMLEKAKETGVYSQFYQECMGKNRLPIAEGTYDTVVTTGSFVPGHVNEESYEDLIRITKKGGHIFILMNERFFKDTPEYSRYLEPRMLELQEQGLWKRVLKKTKIPNYRDNHTGVLFVLEKC